MDYLMDMAKDVYQFFLRWNYLIVILISAFLIFILARNRTYHSHSFKIRSSLTVIDGYATMLYLGKAGVLSTEQKTYLAEILSSAALIRQVMDEVEKKKKSTVDKTSGYGLRSALTGIDGYCDLLIKSDPKLTSVQAEYLSNVIEASKEIMNEINS